MIQKRWYNTIQQLHIKCSNRKDLEYKNVINIRKILFRHAKKNKIPIFDDIVDATNYLENL